MIDKFVTYKEPHVIEDKEDRKGGIIFRTVARLTDGKHVLISDASHGEGMFKIDETLVFECDEEGIVKTWTELTGGRGIRTDEVIKMLNEQELSYE